MRLAGLKTLVTGGTGLIGSCLIRRLLDRGSNVRATLHRKPAAETDPRIEYFTSDLTISEDCRRALKDIDIVFHCAAYASGSASTPETSNNRIAENVLMDEQVFLAAQAAGVKKFLWVGSTTGYPALGDRPVKEDEMLLGEPHEKYALIGSTKRKTEAMLLAYSRTAAPSMAVIVVRPTHVYGPRENFDPVGSRVSAALMRKVVERQNPIEVWGTGEDVRDLIYVDDVAEAMLVAAEKLDCYEAINLGTGKGTSVKEMLRILLSLEKHTEAKITFKSDRPSTIPVRMVETGKMETLLGFKPSIDVREGFKRTLDWYKKNYNR